MSNYKVKTEYKAISKRTKALLNKEEGFDVEYKQSPAGLESSDIVAFANSNEGGTILIGVREVRTAEGRQRGEVIGCAVGDREKLTILNKAENCIPTVRVDIFIENIDTVPFFRVEIPSGEDKPYCTSGGTYKIRGDGRTNTLDPSKLLQIFEDKESTRFLMRFREATLGLENTLNDTKQRVEAGMSSLLDKVQEMEQSVESSLASVFESAQNAEGLSDEAMCLSDETLGTVNELDRKIESIEVCVSLLDDKVDALLENFGVEDPRIAKIRENMNFYMSEIIEQNKSNSKEAVIAKLKEYFPLVQKEFIEQCYSEYVSKPNCKE